MKIIKPTTFSVSAPGKLILLGEHAVVYGYPCLVASVNRYVTVRMERADNADTFRTPGVTDTAFIEQALAVVRKRYKQNGPVSLVTHSDLGTYGLGSSAAVSVATIAAWAQLFSVRLTPSELFDLAYACVLQVQGKASGFDVAISMRGGTIVFNGADKQVTPVDTNEMPMVVGFSGKKVGTVSMIDRVAEKMRDNPDAVTALFEAMKLLVREGHDAVQYGDWQQLGSCMNRQQKLLVSLGVSTDMLNAMVDAACQAGAYGAKLSGAGGGDCMIAVVSDDRKNDVEQAIKKAGGEIVSLSVGTGKGVW